MTQNLSDCLTPGFPNLSLEILPEEYVPIYVSFTL